MPNTDEPAANWTPSVGSFWVKGRRLSLSTNERKLLAFIYERGRGDQGVDKEDVLHAIWGSDADDIKLIEKPLTSIREKLAEALGLTRADVREVVWQKAGQLGLICDDLSTSASSDGSEAQVEDLPSHVLSASNDITAHVLGIERIWPTRRDWRRDERDGLDALMHEWLPNASVIQILANTFSRRWLGDEQFLEAFEASMVDSDSANCEIILYHPESLVLALRAYDEGDDPDSHSMAEEIGESLSTLRKVHSKLPDMGHLRVWLTHRMEHLHHIFRVDDRMIVFFYLHGVTGSPSPAMLLREPSRLFQVFLNEFSVVRTRAVPYRFGHSVLPAIPESARASTHAPWPWKG